LSRSFAPPLPDLSKDVDARHKAGHGAVSSSTPPKFQ
jgi:hypothetical protein